MAARKNKALDGAEKQQLASALERTRSGGAKLSRAEQSLLRRHQQEQEEKKIEEFLHAIPKGVWERMSGRQDRTLNEQARRYGIPIGGPTIDLYEVAKWLHDFLAANTRKLAADPESSPAREQLAREQARLVRLRADKLEGTLVEQESVDQLFVAWSRAANQLGQKLRRSFGDPAYELFEDFLHTCEAILGPDAEEQNRFVDAPGQHDEGDARSGAAGEVSAAAGEQEGVS